LYHLWINQFSIVFFFLISFYTSAQNEKIVLQPENKEYLLVSVIENKTVTDSLFTFNLTKQKIEPGLHSWHFSYHAEEKYLIENTTTEIDSTKYALWAFGEPHQLYIHGE
jgi:hypothetical protein